MKISPSHPRATSLLIREKIVKGVKKGLTSFAGLTAHGRGEAFDYLLGEKTHQFATHAIKAACAYLLLAKRPAISINGNAAALSAKEMVTLAKILNCKIEVNLFHYSKKRVGTIERYLKKIDKNVLYESGSQPKTIIPGIASSRKIALREGIAKSDVVLVPLEDGDRCQALGQMGKKVITIDLNPLSRTSQAATVTIVDNITRALPLFIKTTKHLQTKTQLRLRQIVRKYDNGKTLVQAMKAIQNHIGF